MTYQELRKALKEGKAVTSKRIGVYYLRMEEGKCVVRNKYTNEVCGQLGLIQFDLQEILSGETNFKIYEKPILGKVEKRYLSEVIRPFRKDYEIQIKKCWENNDKEFITIITKKLANSLIECVYLPFFEKGEMYKGMEAGKDYTLEELGL